jgi:hypothetical protein
MVFCECSCCVISVQDLWNRYSDGRAVGGCPHVGYFAQANFVRS